MATTKKRRTSRPPPNAKPRKEKAVSGKALADRIAPAKRTAAKSATVRTARAATAHRQAPPPSNVKSHKEMQGKGKLTKGSAAVVVPTPKPPVSTKPLSRELRDLRSRLVHLLTQIRADIHKEVRGAGERDLAHILDTSDMASDAAEGELSFRIAESEGVEATEVQKAIDKIDGGSYGLCEGCGRQITPERLRFLPFATLCVRCQALSEIRRKEDGDLELDDLAEAEETHEEA